VLSLGCGFDSLYFRLCGLTDVPDTTSVYEVDFPAVVRRKQLLIERTEALKSLLRNQTPPGGGNGKGSVVLDSQGYKLIGVNLGDVVALDSALEGAGLQWDCPTLILAEVVLCYMDPARSDDVIGWSSQRFSQSRFVLYEQFFPDDAFGRVMVAHFESLNSPLRSVRVYPRLQDQEQRFLQKGWQCCRVLDMNEFSALCVPHIERLRIDSLEPFDEFEELHLKCSHYFILVASRGDLARNPALQPVVGSSDFTVFPAPACGGAVLAKLLSPAVLGLRRFGHRSCLVSSEFIISTGGFGEGNGKHQRLGDVHLLLEEEETWSREVTTSQWDGRLLHSLTPLTMGGFLVLGGRFSPSRPAAEAQILTYEKVAGAVTITRRHLPLELRRWRHTATEVSLCGHFYVLVFGGRTTESAALQDATFLHTEDMSWAEVCQHLCASRGWVRWSAVGSVSDG
ncbi:tRNA wybutosine-synthesizing protein 4-like, partial [Leptodactylus fuscus]|uniref:tRNA wybutosine-synthesizing protein 4-like n=1 Tax=Leptodactylus fuscus TaxID=238119 RepID=UPI003F4EA7FF